MRLENGKSTPARKLQRQAIGNSKAQMMVLLSIARRSPLHRCILSDRSRIAGDGIPVIMEFFQAAIGNGSDGNASTIKSSCSDEDPE